MDCTCATRFGVQLKILIESLRDSEAKSILNNQLDNVNDCCCTLLHHAVSVGEDKVTRFLVQQGMSDVNCFGPTGQTPLMLAVTLGMDAIVEVLLEVGADIDVVDANGRSALQMALQQNTTDTEIVRAFVGKIRRSETTIEELVERLSVAGFTAFHAMRLQDVDILKCLLQRGAGVNARNDSGDTPLHFAAMYNNFEVAKLLVDHGADVNAIDVCGCNCLFYAALRRNSTTMQLLLEHGADPNPNNRQGVVGTPLFAVLYLARGYYNEEENRECAELLLRHGAFPRNFRAFLETVYETIDEELETTRLHFLIAHYAMSNGSTAESIAHCELKKYYDECRQALEIAVIEKLSLLRLLTDGEHEMRTHARNKEFSVKIKAVCEERRLGELYPYYYNLLVGRVEKAVNFVRMEKVAIAILCEYCELLDSNEGECYIAARRVVGYLKEQDLQRLCSV